MAYRLNNPCTSTMHRTLADAKAAAHRGLDSIAAKRGYSMVESKARKGNTVLHYFTVLNSKGKAVTGCVIYKTDEPMPRRKYVNRMDAIERHRIAAAAAMRRRRVGIPA